MAGREPDRSRQPNRPSVNLRSRGDRPRVVQFDVGKARPAAVPEPEAMIDRAVHDFIVPSLLLRETAGRIALINEASRRNAENRSVSVELAEVRAATQRLHETHPSQEVDENSKTLCLVADGPMSANVGSSSKVLVDDEATADMQDGSPVEDSEILACALAALECDGSLIAERWAALRKSGYGAEDLYLGLLSPIAVELGRRWLADESSFGDVTMGMTILHKQLHASYGELEAEASKVDGSRSILLAPAPGTDHVFGAAMVELFFRAYGWSVTSGVGLSEDELLAKVAGNDFDVLGLSLGSHDSNKDYADLVVRLREASPNKDLVVMAGGAPFIDEPELAEKLGADATAPDAKRAVSWARRLVTHKRVI